MGADNPGGFRQLKEQISKFKEQERQPGKNKTGKEAANARVLSQAGPSVQFSSVTQSCPTLCVPKDCSMPGFSVHHQLPEFAQTHVL